MIEDRQDAQQDGHFFGVGHERPLVQKMRGNGVGACKLVCVKGAVCFA
jgi:hypothetical protein